MITTKRIRGKEAENLAEELFRLENNRTLSQEQMRAWYDETDEFKCIILKAAENGVTAGGIYFSPEMAKKNCTDAVAILDYLAIYQTASRKKAGRQLFVDGIKEVRRHWERYGYKLKGIVWHVESAKDARFYDWLLSFVSTRKINRQTTRFGRIHRTDYSVVLK